MPVFNPTGPYIIKFGFRKGKSLEELMFEDYPWLVQRKERMDSCLKPWSKPNQMHTHLCWLLERGEDRIAKTVCPHCGEKIISFFGYSFKDKKYFVCCDQILCAGKLLVKTYRHPLKFSSILNFQGRSKPFITAFFKKVFLPDCENPDAKIPFKFFSVKSSP
jgi:hypothetical protein